MTGCRVLKPAALLNFDAGWYTYLFDEQKQAAFQADRANVAAARRHRPQRLLRERPDGGNLAQPDSQPRERPKADVQMLGKAGFRSVRADTEIWKRTWDDVEKVNFASTPLFLLCAQK